MSDTQDTYVEVRFYGPTNTKGHRAGIFRGGRRVAVIPEGQDWEAVTWVEDAATAWFTSNWVTVIAANTVYLPGGVTGSIVKVTVESDSYNAFVDRELAKIIGSKEFEDVIGMEEGF
jgi:hypothetical protein